MRLPNVSSPFGAPMGRVNLNPDENQAIKLHVRRVRINSGGYDSGGAYWGFGSPLYVIYDDDENIRFFRRSVSRESLKSSVRLEFPGVKFYR